MFTSALFQTPLFTVVVIQKARPPIKTTERLNIMSQSDAGAKAREKADQAKAAAEDGKDTLVKKLQDDGV